MKSDQPVQRMLDKTHKPTEEDIIHFIADDKAVVAWKRMRKFLDTRYDLKPETVFYGQNYGWLIRYRKSGRTLVSLFPERGSFSVNLIYGKKEVEKFIEHKLDFSQPIIEIFQTTKQLHDGRWMWIRVTDTEYSEDLEKMLTIKRKPKESS